ncbi:MAG: hypothetical protein AAGG08_06000 [Actinomycetota bacterium]
MAMATLWTIAIIGTALVVFRVVMWWGDRPRSTSLDEVTGRRSVRSGMDRRRSVERDASAGFTNMHGPGC